MPLRSLATQKLNDSSHHIILCIIPRHDCCIIIVYNLRMAQQFLCIFHNIYSMHHCSVFHLSKQKFQLIQCKLSSMLDMIRNIERYLSYFVPTCTHLRNDHIINNKQINPCINHLLKLFHT